MTIDPIVPVWLMLPVSVLLICIKRRGIFATLRQLAVIVLLMLLNLRIAVPDGNVSVVKQQMNTNVLFVVDDTLSMYAKDDGEHTRMDAVKEDLGRIAEQLSGSRYGMMIFHNHASMPAPMAESLSYIKGALAAVGPLESYYATGTSLSVCKEELKKVLMQLKEKNNGDVVVFLASDGEDTTESMQESFQELAPYIDFGAVLGYGTKEGGQIYITPRYGEYDEATQSFLEPEEQLLTCYDDNYEEVPAVSYIDETNLKRIADEMGVEYILMKQSSDVDGLLSKIRMKADRSVTEQKREGKKVIDTPFLIPLILLLVLEVIIGEKGYQRKDETKYSF